MKKWNFFIIFMINYNSVLAKENDKQDQTKEEIPIFVGELKNELVSNYKKQEDHPVNLKKGGLYIYSYLDAVPGEYSEDFRVKIKNIIIEKFNVFKINSNFYDFSQSSFFNNFDPKEDTKYEDNRRAVLDPYGSSMRYQYDIPFEKVVNENRKNEEIGGFEYRMTIQPSSFSKRGAWTYYSIFFRIDDIITGNTIWYYTYDGKYIFIAPKDNYSRANKIIDSMFDTIINQGLVK